MGSKADVYRYKFLGLDPEDFPVPPLARRLFPGDVVELPEPVEHARLKLLSAPEPPSKSTKKEG